jgi:1-acyl-sn-glycerol-3-phosphate acyltransferase
VPIAIHGSSKIRNWKRLQFPKVTVQYGDAMRWESVENATREQQQAVAEEVLTEIKALYNGLEEHGRKGMLRRARAERRAQVKGTATA